MRFDFSQALAALNEGRMVRRDDWEKDMFLFLQTPSTINKEVVPRMQSLPDRVKVEFERRFESPSFQIDAIYYSNQVACVNSSNLIVGYSFSVSDVLSKNWELYEPR